MARKIGSHGRTTGPLVREAALRLMAEHGFASVSMRQIAAEVGLQAGALYSYTPDKQSLLTELMVAALTARQAAWEQEARPDEPTAWLDAFTRFHLAHIRTHPAETALLQLERRNLDATGAAQVAALVEAYEAPLIDVLTRGGKAAQFAVPRPRLAAAAVLALLDGVAAFERATGGLPPKRIERLAWNMVRRAVGAKGQA